MLVRALMLAALGAAAVAPAAHARDPIVPLSDVHRGLHCTALTVVQGTDITSFDVDVIDIVADANPQDTRILVRVSGPAVEGTGIAEGFSGSPVYCPDAEGAIGNAGAISATVGQYGANVGLVTPIEQMLGVPVHPPSAVRRAPRLLRSARRLASPIVVSGLSPGLGQLVAKAARQQGRPLAIAPAGPLATFAPQPLVPGASMAVGLSSGAIAAGAIGTVTYRDGDAIYGFGHPFVGVGRRSLLLQDAYVFTVIGTPLDTGDQASYKLAAPGHDAGTLTDDALPGVVGTLGALPRMVPVTVKVHDADTGATLRQRTDVADEVDVGDPMGMATIPTVSSFAVMQAISTAFDGAPSRESGVLCLHVRVRELPDVLRFCNRYVANDPADGEGVGSLAMPMGGDVSSGLAVIDQARYARLHVQSVAVGATIERGLALATIELVRGPRTARRGQRIPIAMRVRLDRGPLRTIRFRLRIPRDAPKGRKTIRFLGTPLGGGGDGPLAEMLGVLGIGGGSGDGPSSGAGSKGELIVRFLATQGWDGITAKLPGTRWHAYRNGQVRIDGRGELDVRIVDRRHRASLRQLERELAKPLANRPPPAKRS